jgi:hypothetical protein
VHSIGTSKSRGKAVTIRNLFPKANFLKMGGVNIIVRTYLRFEILNDKKSIMM